MRKPVGEFFKYFCLGEAFVKDVKTAFWRGSFVRLIISLSRMNYTSLMFCEAYLYSHLFCRFSDFVVVFDVSVYLFTVYLLYNGCAIRILAKRFLEKGFCGSFSRSTHAWFAFNNVKYSCFISFAIAKETVRIKDNAGKLWAFGMQLLKSIS